MAIFTAIGLAVGSLISTFSTAITAASVTSFITRTVAKVLTNYLVSAILGTNKKPAYSLSGKLQAGEDVPRSFPMGRTITRGSLVYANSFSYDGSAPNGWMAYVIALSDLPIPGSPVNRMSVNGKWVTIDTGNEHPDLGFPVDEYRGRFTTGAAGFLFVKFYDGTQTVADPFLVSTFQNDPDDARKYTSARVGKGIAYAVVFAHVEQTLFSGWPRFAFEVNGIPLYDPSKDTTAGGTGTQRWNDSSTWGGDGDDFPVVHAYNILRGITYGGAWLYGFQNIGAGQLPDASWIAAIEKCRLPVSINGGGTEPQFRAGIEVTVNVAIGDGVEQILTACAGRLADAGGIYSPAVGISDTPVMSFTDDDIISTDSETFSPFQGLDDTINGVTASYPEPEELYAVKQAPPLFSPDFEVLDGNRRLLADVSLPNVPYAEQVQRLLQGTLNEARRARRHTLTLPPEYALLEPNDVIEWTTTRHGYSAKRFRVDGIVVKPNCDAVLDLTEVDPSDWDWDPNTDYRPVTPRPISPIAPGPVTVGGFAVQGITITDDGGTGRRAAIEISWTINPLLEEVVRAVRWQVRLPTSANLVNRNSSHDIEDGSAIVSDGVVGNTDYEVRMRFVVPGRATDWTSWVAVTTPDVRIPVIELDPTIPADIQTAIDTANDADTLATQTAADLTAATNQLTADINATLTEAIGLASQLQGVLSDPYLSTESTETFLNFPAEGTLSKTANTVYSTGQTWRLQSVGTQDMGIRVESETTIWVGDPALNALVAEVVFTPRGTDNLAGAGMRMLWVYDSNTNFVVDKVDLADAVASPVVQNRVAVARWVFVNEGPLPSPGVFEKIRFYFESSSDQYTGGAGAQHDQDIEVHKIFIRPALEEEIASGRVAAAIETAITSLSADIETHTGVSLSASLSDTYYTIVAGDNAIAAEIALLQAEIEDPNGSSLGATVEANRVAAVDADSALAADILNLYATTATNTITFIPSTANPDTTADVFCGSRDGDPTDPNIGPLNVSGWEILAANGRLRCNDIQGVGGSASANVYTRRVLSVTEGQRVRARAQIFTATGDGLLTQDAFSFRFVWLDQDYAELGVGSSYRFMDLTADGSSGSEIIETNDVVTPAGARYCRLGVYFRAEFGTPVPAYATIQSLEFWNAEVTSGLQASLNNVLAVDVNSLTGTALATLLNDLGVDANGNSATVTQLNSAVADLEGNAAALLSFRVQAGSGGALLELVASDDATGPAETVARISAQNILLDGSVTTRALAVANGWGNAIMDPCVIMGDFRNWQNVPSGWSVDAGNPSSPTNALKAPPTPYVVKMPVDAANQLALVQTIVEPGREGTRWAYGFMYATGGATRDATFRVRVVYRKADGTYISEHNETLASQANTSWRIWPDYDGLYGTADGSATGKDQVPAECGYIEVYFGRNAGGSGDAYMTSLTAQRQSRGGTLIEDGTITTTELNAASLNAGGINIFDGTVESDNYAEDGGGVPTAGFKLDASTGEIKGVSIIGRQIIGATAISDYELDETEGPYASTLTGTGTEEFAEFILYTVDDVFATETTVSLEARSRPLGASSNFRIYCYRDFLPAGSVPGDETATPSKWLAFNGELLVRDNQSNSNTYVPFSYFFSDLGNYYAVRYRFAYNNEGGADISGQNIVRNIRAKSKRSER